MTDAHGNELVALSIDDLDGLDGVPDPGAPLTGALVVVTGPEGVLLVHDVWRDQWELAGGGIEAHETPAEAARREVAEESGQQLADLWRVGRVTVRLADGGRLEQAELFRGTLAEVAPFDGNDETDAICWWDSVSALAGLARIDAELVRRVLDAERA